MASKLTLKCDAAKAKILEWKKPSLIEQSIQYEQLLKIGRSPLIEFSSDVKFYNDLESYYLLDHGSKMLSFIYSSIMSEGLLKQENLGTKKVRVLHSEVHWREFLCLHNKGLMSTIFWQHLIASDCFIVADANGLGSQSRFWGNRIAEAYDRGATVFYWNLEDDSLEKVSTLDEFRLLSYDISQDAKKLQSTRLIFAK